MTITVRHATKADRALLEQFTCVPAACPPWQRWIQTYLRAHAITASNSRPAAADHAVLLIEEEGRAGPVGVASVGRHRTGAMSGWLIDTAAVASELQGKQLDDGRRASDVILAAAFDHVRAHDLHVLPVPVFANVHAENQQSLGVLRRNGFSGFEPDPELPDHLLAVVLVGPPPGEGASGGFR